MRVTRLVLLANISIALHSALIVRASCPTSNFALDKPDSRSLISLGCGTVGTVPDMGICRFEDSEALGTNPLCGVDIMVRDFLCVGGQWLWAPNARFCPQWQGCEWEGFALRCNGDGVGNTLFKAASNLDARLRLITISNRRTLRVLPDFFTTGLSDLRTLTITNTSLARIHAGALSSLSRLESLNLSGNLLTYLDSNKLPPYNNLDYLDLRNNSFQRPGFAPAALQAAMSTCAPTINPRVLYTDDDMCTMYTDQRGCQLVNCTAAAQNVVHQSCDATNATAPVIETTQLCDGEYDCPNRIDELYCQAEIKILTTIGGNISPEQEFCNSVAGDVLPDFRGSYGLGVISLKVGSFVERLYRVSATIFDMGQLLQPSSEDANVSFVSVNSTGNGGFFTFRLVSDSTVISRRCPIVITPYTGLASSPITTMAQTTTQPAVQSSQISKRLDASATTILASLISVACVIFLVVWAITRCRRRRAERTKANADPATVRHIILIGMSSLSSVCFFSIFSFISKFRERLCCRRLFKPWVLFRLFGFLFVARKVLFLTWSVFVLCPSLS